MLSRGQGYLAPLLLVLSFLFMMPSHELGVKLCQSLALGWIVLCGLFIVWYGRRKLHAAAAALGRPLTPLEHVLDLEITESKPFHSFMFVQMPWWGLAYVWAAYKMLMLILKA